MGNSTEHYLQLLHYWDERKGPTGSDYDAAAQRFLDFARDLEQACGISLNAEAGGASLQDATFIGRLFLRGWLIRNWTDLTDSVQLRVSIWGNLATVTDQTRFHPDAWARISALLQQYGYVYIPPEVLELPYSGRYFGSDDTQIWWIRYFEWG